NATSARTAVIPLRGIGFQIERRDNLSQKNPIAEFPADHIGVLADESQPRPLRQIALQQRAGVDVPKRTRVTSSQLVDKGRKRSQPLANDFVVVGETGVAGDRT